MFWRSTSGFLFCIDHMAEPSVTSKAPRHSSQSSWRASSLIGCFLLCSMRRLLDVCGMLPFLFLVSSAYVRDILPCEPHSSIYNGFLRLFPVPSWFMSHVEGAETRYRLKLSSFLQTSFPTYVPSKHLLSQAHWVELLWVIFNLVWMDQYW